MTNSRHTARVATVLIASFCHRLLVSSAFSGGSTKTTFKVSVVVDSFYLSNDLAPAVTAKAKSAFAKVLHSASTELEEAQLDVIMDVSQISTRSSPDADRLVNPLRITSQELCTCIINGSVTVVLVHPPFYNKHLSSTISYSLSFYRVPIISISSRDIEFSDKSIYSSFLRTVPSWTEEADVWLNLLLYFDFKQVMLVFPDEPNALLCIGRFLEASAVSGIQVQKYVKYEENLQSATAVVKEIETSNCNIIIMIASTEDAYVIFKEITRTGIGLGRSRALIVNELALRANNTPPGLIGAKLSGFFNTEQQLKNAFQVVISGLITFKRWADERKIQIFTPQECDEFPTGNEPRSKQAFQWVELLGPKLYDFYITTRLYDKDSSTLLAFDSGGNKVCSMYHIVNTQAVAYVESRGSDIALQVSSTKVGHYYYSVSSDAMKIEITADIIWFEGHTTRPTTFTLSTYLKAVTVVDPPFVYTTPVRSEQECQELARADGSWHYCTYQPPGSIGSSYVQHFCCRGICIDLLDLLSKNNYTPFTYDIHLSYDGVYGEKVLSNTSGQYEWTGVVRELIDGDADITVSALTISPEKSTVIDFTKPWLYHGITILEKQKPRLSPMETFLQPFRWPLWTGIIASVLTVGLVMFILDHYSPICRRFYTTDRASKKSEEEAPVTFVEAMWFVWGVMLDSGIGEKAPRSFSGRVLAIVWCGFSVIMVASYTANLAVVLVLDQPVKSLSGINDPRLKTPTANCSYATVKDSYVYDYFKRHIEHSTLFRTMEPRNYRTAEEAINAVRDGSLDAFIWDTTRLETVAAQSCDLTTSGAVFGRSAYGVGLRKDSLWTPIINIALLQIMEDGQMEDLDSKWISGVTKLKCKPDSSAPVRLGLNNMRDVFILVAGGIVLGCVFISLEIFISRVRASKQRQRRLARRYSEIWRKKTRTSERAKRDNANESFSTGPPYYHALPLKQQPPHQHRSTKQRLLTIQEDDSSHCGGRPASKTTGPKNKPSSATAVPCRLRKTVMV